MLELYAEHFRAVEVNATYYRIPPPATMASLAARTPPDFEFLVKAHQSMTHEQAVPDTFEAFRACVAPLAASGKLRGVLLQFPWKFRPTLGARKRLALLGAELPPLARLTGDVGYVRFHGRNTKTWWGGGGDRYDYDYSPGELKEWVAKIRELAEKASKVYVFFNNCHAGQAARNALLMRDMLQQDLMAGVR